MRPLATQPLNSPALITTKTTANSVSYAQQQLAISFSEGSEKAYNECKAKVDRIAAQCRVKNRKVRVVEFDLENDASCCLHNFSVNSLFVASDVRGLPDIFENPVSFSGSTPKSVEIVLAMNELAFMFSIATCQWVPVIVDE